MTRHSRRSFALLALCVVPMAACAAPPAASEPETGEAVVLSTPSRAGTVDVPTPAPPALPAPIDLRAVVREAAPLATIGAVVFDREQEQEVVAVNAERQFRAASLVKLLIAIDLLAEGDARPELAADIRRMLSASDDATASSLWASGGLTAILDRTTARIGLRQTSPPENAYRWGDTLLSAADVVRIYRHVLHDLPEQGRTLILDALAAAPRLAADGWDQYFGIPDGIGQTSAVKQGWSNNPDNLVVHSTGLVGQDWRNIVVLLVEGPIEGGWDSLRIAATTAAEDVGQVLPGTR